MQGWFNAGMVKVTLINRSLATCRDSRGLRPGHRAAVLLAIAVVVGALLAGCGGRHEFAGTPYDPIIEAPEIVGTNQEGSAFRLSDLQGRVTLLFFGYTFCPDICPTTLGLMSGVAKQLGDRADELAVVLVSVDPERDSPERLNVYISAFNDDFIGVHLEDEALAQAKTDYGVFAEKRVLNPDQSKADYLIDHTGWIYLIDPDGQLRAVFGTDATVSGIVGDVRYLMGQ